MDTKLTTKETTLAKLYLSIKKYKWLILGLTSLALPLMLLYISLQHKTYESNSILQIQSHIPSNHFNKNAETINRMIEREITLLKTFSMNEQTINDTNMSVRYFKNDEFQSTELYTTSPIQVSSVSSLDPIIMGKTLTLTPHGDSFSLSLEENFLNSFSSITVTALNPHRKYSYGKEIENNFFQLTIDKNEKFTEPIQFIFYGSTRDIFNTIIYKNLKVKQLKPSTPLIKISYQDTIEERSTDYVNRLMQNVIKKNINSKNKQNLQTLSYINQELSKIKVALDASEKKLELYKIRHNLVEPSTKGIKYIGKLSQLEVQLSNNLLKKELIKNLLKIAQENKELKAMVPSLIELDDKETIKLVDTYQELKVKENRLKLELDNKDPELLSLHTKMSNLRSQILYSLQNLNALIEEKKDSLEKEKDSYAQVVQRLPKEEKELIGINRDYEVSYNTYNYYLNKKNEMELLLISTVSDYKIIDTAHSKTIELNKTFLLSIALLTGLFLSTLLAIILYALNKKISSYKELENLTQIPIVGVIPELTKRKVRLEVYQNLQSRFTESYRSLRTNLPSKKSEEKSKIILCTSIIANEGKTTVTSNLASTFQMAGHKCIILNLDLRQPTLHHYFNLNNDKGMSSYLMGKDSVQEIIFATKYTNLHVITSGPIPENPSELILSTKLTELLEILETRYDYIFIDTAPIGLVSDSIHLMKLADENLIILRENYTEVSFLSSITNIIEKHNLKNISLVLNRSKSTTTSYGYGYEY